MIKLNKKTDSIVYKSFDEQGIELSGGQEQKVAICRAMYREASILILDEPTALLDPIAEHEIYTNLNRKLKGKTCIYISHRLSSCILSDNIAVFANNTIVEYGKHDDLVRIKGGIYAKMFSEQAQLYL